MTATPAGPRQDEGRRVAVARLQADQQATEFGDTDRDELVAGQWPPFSAAAAARIASASRARVVWRCQPVQERTSYWSRPAWRLPSLKTSPMIHRAPMARTISTSGVSVGANTR